MKNIALRIIFTAVMIWVTTSLSFGVTVVQQDGDKPGLDIYGYQWIRYSDQYNNFNDVSSLIQVPRTYIRTKVKTNDYEGELTLDINNVANDQGFSVATGVTPVSAPNANTYTANTKTLNVVNSATGSGSVDWAIWIKKAFVDLKALPFLKDADMKVRVGQQDSYFGTIDTWQYPVIEKVIEDYTGVISSADMGVALLGNIPMGFGDYQIAVYDGNGYKKMESDLDKPILASVNIVPYAGFSLRGSIYASHLGEDRWIKGAPSALYQQTIKQALVLSYASGPIQSFFELIQQCGPKSAGKSGILEGISGYLGIQLLDPLSLQFMFDYVNPDTFMPGQEYDVYIAGLNYKVASNATLQLNYELKENEYGGKANDASSKDANGNPINQNQLLAQMVWAW